MNIDKTARATLIITNIIIWSLISIVLFFFGIIYVNADTYFLHDTDIYLTNSANLTQRESGSLHIEPDIGIVTEPSNFYNTFAIVGTNDMNNNNEYYMQAKLFLKMKIQRWVYDYGILKKTDFNKYYDILSWFNSYNGVKQYTDISVSVNQITFEGCVENPVCSAIWEVNIYSTINTPSYNVSVINIWTKPRNEVQKYYFDSSYIGYIRSESVGVDLSSTNKLINRGNEITGEIKSDTGNILDNTRSIATNINIQAQRQDITNTKLQNIFDIVNNGINGNYTISNVLRPNTQESLAETGEQAIYTKLGESQVNFEFDQQYIGTGMDFIWTQINNLRIVNPGITTLIMLGILLGICKQALGRKNE